MTGAQFGEMYAPRTAAAPLSYYYGRSAAAPPSTAAAYAGRAYSPSRGDSEYMMRSASPSRTASGYYDRSDLDAQFIRSATRSPPRTMSMMQPPGLTMGYHRPARSTGAAFPSPVFPSRSQYY